MNPDPDLKRLEERVREAFPACQHPQIIIPQREPIPQAPFFPKTSLDCWSRYILTNTWERYPEEDPSA